MALPRRCQLSTLPPSLPLHERPDDGAHFDKSFNSTGRENHWKEIKNMVQVFVGEIWPDKDACRFTPAKASFIRELDIESSCHLFCEVKIEIYQVTSTSREILYSRQQETYACRQNVHPTPRQSTLLHRPQSLTESNVQVPLELSERKSFGIDMPSYPLSRMLKKLRSPSQASILIAHALATVDKKRMSYRHLERAAESSENSWRSSNLNETTTML
jgi:hypothetical protein